MKSFRNNLSAGAPRATSVSQRQESEACLMSFDGDQRTVFKIFFILLQN